jgi:hypothetical protein
MVDAMANKPDIVRIIETELQRQGISAVDAEALAAAIAASSEPGPTVVVEGKRPEDLNSANDD